MKFKILILLATALLATTAQADEQLTENVEFKLMKVNRMLDRQMHMLSRSELKAISRKLDKVIEIVRFGVPNPPPVHEPERLRYQADCHIDNDPYISWNENVIATLKGSSPTDLLAECKELAKMTYGSNFSAGILNINISGRNDEAQQAAICHIDNDQYISFDETVLGTIAGHSAEEVLNTCLQLAKATFGSNSSAGIKQLNEGLKIPHDMYSATCHIDNDPYISYDENIVGTVIGTTAMELAKTCSAIASITYGTNSSAGVKNIQ